MSQYMWHTPRRWLGATWILFRECEAGLSLQRGSWPSSLCGQHTWDHEAICVPHSQDKARVVLCVGPAMWSLLSGRSSSLTGFD